MFLGRPVTRPLLSFHQCAPASRRAPHFRQSQSHSSTFSPPSRQSHARVRTRSLRDISHVAANAFGSERHLRETHFDDDDNEDKVQGSNDLEREEGVVEWFDTIKGFGFISATSDKTSVFVHYSSIVGKSYRGLCDDQVVQFSRELTPRGDYVARNVTTPEGQTIPASARPRSPIEELSLRVIQLSTPLLPVSPELEQVVESIHLLHPKQLAMLLRTLPRARSVELHRVLEIYRLHSEFTIHSVLLRLVGDRADIETAISFLLSFHEKGVLASFHYQVVVQALGEKGDWETALWLLDDLEAQGISIDVGLCNLFCHLAGQVKDGEVAINLLDRMEEVGVPITEQIYEDTIIALLGQGNLTVAQSMIERLWQANSPPSLHTHQEFILALGEGGQWGEAEEVLNKMLQAGMQINICVYNSLIDALGMCGQWERAVAVLTVMKRVGVPPGNSTYELLLEALVSGQQWDYMEAVLHQYQVFCKSKNLSQSPLDLNIYHSLLQALCDAGERDRAQALLCQMQEEGLKPDPQCYRTVIDLLGEEQDWQLVADTLKALASQR